MDYKIIKKEAFNVIEKVETHSMKSGINEESIPDFWTRCHKDGTVKKLLELTNDKTYIFGICYGNLQKDTKTFNYSIGAVSSKNADLPEGVRKTIIPSRSLGGFECKGAMLKTM